MGIEELIGKTLIRVEGAVGDDEIHFTADDGQRYVMDHDQDCCENVQIEDITGDLADLVGSPILFAMESSSEAHEQQVSESGTWTFYKLATAKGWVDIRWLGESNGYYSESVNFRKLVG